MDWEIWRSGVGASEHRKGRAGQMGMARSGLAGDGRSYGAAAPELLHKLAFATPALVLEGICISIGSQGVYLGKAIVSSSCLSASSPRGHSLLYVIYCLTISLSATSHCSRKDQGIQFRTEFLHAWGLEKREQTGIGLVTNIPVVLSFYCPIRNLVRLISSRVCLNSSLLTCLGAESSSGAASVWNISSLFVSSRLLIPPVLAIKGSKVASPLQKSSHIADWRNHLFLLGPFGPDCTYFLVFVILLFCFFLSSLSRVFSAT